MYNDWYDKLFQVVFWIMGWFCLLLSIIFVMFFFFPTINAMSESNDGISWLTYSGFGMVGFMIFAGIQAIIHAMYLTQK